MRENLKLPLLEFKGHARDNRRNVRRNSQDGKEEGKNRKRNRKRGKKSERRDGRRTERRGRKNSRFHFRIFQYPVRSCSKCAPETGIGIGLDRCRRATWRRNLARDRNYEGISWKSWPTRADKVSGEGGRASLRTPSDEMHAISAVIQRCFPKWERGLAGS